MAFNAQAAAVGNALERQDDTTARREEEDYNELQNAALEKVDPAARSRHAVLRGKGNKNSI